MSDSRGPVYEDGKWYNGCVITHVYLFEANTGSLGFGIDMDGPHGNISGVLWLTDKAYPKTIERFEEWGLKPDDWQNPQFSVDPDKWLAGKSASVCVEIEEYEDKDSGELVRRAKAKAISTGGGGPQRTSSPKAISRAQALFSKRTDAPLADDDFFGGTSL